jgi:hypothetical protein
MKSERTNAPIPDLLLERYRLNELSPAERAAVECRLDEDDTLRERLHGIERSDELIRESGFTASLAKHLRGHSMLDTTSSRANAEITRASQKVRQWALPVAVGVAIVLFVVLGSRTGGPKLDNSTDERIKGLRPSLTMFRQTHHGSEALSDGVAARAGDVIRLAYQAAGRKYGVILSIDGRGGVTVHLPTGGRDAARLQPGDKVLLDHAYELDDAPRWECFYFVTAQEPFDAQPVIDAAKREGALRRDSEPPNLTLTPGLEQSTFVLSKEPRP